MQPEPLQNWKDRIVVDKVILIGKPVIKGTRLTVEFIVDLLAHGWTEAEILENYPGIMVEGIRACLAYASVTLHADTSDGALDRKILIRENAGYLKGNGDAVPNWDAGRDPLSRTELTSERTGKRKENGTTMRLNRWKRLDIRCRVGIRW